MPRKAALTVQDARLAKLLANAWTRADMISRKYPRVFAQAVAMALELTQEQKELFILAFTNECKSLEEDRRGQGFGSVR